MSHQLWNVCRKYSISPNQLHFLDGCRERIAPSKVINEDVEKAICIERGWIDAEGTLSSGAIFILDEFELVLDAADYYVNYYKKVDYKYMTCSLYFIEKDGISKLADTCQAIIDNPKILDI